MTTSELAELMSQLEFSKRCRWEANRSYCSPVIREEDVDHIIKSLRFAADMDRLLLRRPCFTNNENDCTIRVTQGSVERIGFHGSDIYSAARKAVEALEGE